MGMGTSGWTAIVAILHNLWQNCCGINCPVTLAHSGTGIWVTGPFASKNNAYRILWAVWLWHPYFSILNFQPYSIYAVHPLVPMPMVSTCCMYLLISLTWWQNTLTHMESRLYHILHIVQISLPVTFGWTQSSKNASGINDLKVILLLEHNH
jgi:hypothetical protein